MKMRAELPVSHRCSATFRSRFWRSGHLCCSLGIRSPGRSPSVSRPGSRHQGAKISHLFSQLLSRLEVIARSKTIAGHFVSTTEIDFCRSGAPRKIVVLPCKMVDLWHLPRLDIGSISTSTRRSGIALEWSSRESSVRRSELLDHRR